MNFDRSRVFCVRAVFSSFLKRAEGVSYFCFSASRIAALRFSLQLSRCFRIQSRSALSKPISYPAFSDSSHLYFSISSRSRSEEHTSELQSRGHLVCRLLLEKKKYIMNETVIMR